VPVLVGPATVTRASNEFNRHGDRDAGPGTTSPAVQLASEGGPFDPPGFATCGRRPLIFKLNFRVTVMPVVRVTGGGSQRPSLAGFESPADYHRSMPPSVGGMSIVMFEVTSRRSL
jgi:hypothetical protein